MLAQVRSPLQIHQGNVILHLLGVERKSKLLFRLQAPPVSLKDKLLIQTKSIAATDDVTCTFAKDASS